MKQTDFLTFLGRIAALKDVPRHCRTPGGQPESVSAHSWRIAVMALLLEPELPGIDMDRVMRMCLVHDFGEAVTGDIATFQKTERDERVEEDALTGLTGLLPDPQRGSIRALFAEMEAQQTDEARLFRALDKLEAVISHNESDIASWIPLEYGLNLTYAYQEAAPFPYLAALREQMCRDTERKIAAAGGPPQDTHKEDQPA